MKDKILRVGTISFDPITEIPDIRNWWFSGGCGNAFVADSPDGLLVAGWTVPELMEIQSRPSEFVEMEIP